MRENFDDPDKTMEVSQGEFVKLSDFTCWNCGIKKTCYLAFDSYNTNGDCIADK